MQLIGFLGGMSWESTAEYYRLANEMVRDRSGGLHSARCVTYSVDFAGIERMQVEGRWDDAAEALVAAGRSLEASGADFLVLCTNTMHKVADALDPCLDEAVDDLAVGLARLVADHAEAQLVIDDPVHGGLVLRGRDDDVKAVTPEPVGVERLRHREAGAEQPDPSCAGVLHRGGRSVADVQQGDVDRSCDLVGDLVHGVRAQDDKVGTGGLQ